MEKTFAELLKMIGRTFPIPSAAVTGAPTIFSALPGSLKSEDFGVVAFSDADASAVPIGADEGRVVAARGRSDIE